MMRVFDGTKDPGETIALSFDFTDRLAGAAISGTPAAVSQTWSGVDSNPGAILSGGCAVAGPVVTQKVTGGIAGVDYRVKVTAQTNDGRVLVLAGILAVREG